MEASKVDDFLTLIILLGLVLSIGNLVVSVFNGRSSEMAHVKALSNLRELYERNVQKAALKTRRLISTVRPGKPERRKDAGSRG